MSNFVDGKPEVMCIDPDPYPSYDVYYKEPMDIYLKKVDVYIKNLHKDVTRLRAKIEILENTLYDIRENGGRSMIPEFDYIWCPICETKDMLNLCYKYASDGEEFFECERCGAQFDLKIFNRIKGWKEDSEMIETAKTICKEEIENLKMDFYGPKAVKSVENILKVLEGGK